MNCQTFSTGFSSGERGGSGRSVMFPGTTSAPARVPSRLVEQENGVGVRRHRGADLGEMRLHGLGVAERHDEAGALALGRADRPEE